VFPSSRLTAIYSESVGRKVVDESRKCPMCGHTTWILLDGHSTLQALEGGLEALAYSCDQCGFIRWHRMDKANRPSSPGQRKETR
jgi:ribosomal protein S27AE